MPTITRLTAQKKGKRYNIYIDDQYAFSVDEDILVKFNLRKGLELDSDMIKQITAEDDLQKLYHRVLHFLSYRMRTEREIYDYLTKYDALPEQVTKIMERLKKERLVDDEEFAKLFVQSRLRTSLKGPKLIQQELRDRGIADSYTQEALKLYDVQTQFEKAQTLLVKKGRKSDKRSYLKQLESLKMTLKRYGFSDDVIHHVISESKPQIDDEVEWQALCDQGEKYFRKYAKKHTGYELQMKVKSALYRQGFMVSLIDQFIEEHLKDDA